MHKKKYKSQGKAAFLLCICCLDFWAITVASCGYGVYRLVFGFLYTYTGEFALDELEYCSWIAFALLDEKSDLEREVDTAVHCTRAMERQSRASLNLLL